MLSHKPDISWQEFARLTIETNDLDPVYVALNQAKMPEAMLLRWCTAFVTYYHMGTACQICHLQGDDFWAELFNRYETSPRASERRHFRGQAGLKAMRVWRNIYRTPEKFFLECMQPSFMTLLKKNIPQIGTYFTWKCMDFREAVFGYDVDWGNAHKHMVTLPTQGLDIIYPGVPHPQALLQAASELKHLSAPPRHHRKCGVAEAETVACMLKGYYLHGKPIGKDIVEKRRDLTGYGDVAEHILSFMPVEPFDAP